MDHNLWLWSLSFPKSGINGVRRQQKPQCSSSTSNSFSEDSLPLLPHAAVKVSTFGAQSLCRGQGSSRPSASKPPAVLLVQFTLLNKDAFQNSPLPEMTIYPGLYQGPLLLALSKTQKYFGISKRMGLKSITYQAMTSTQTWTKVTLLKRLAHFLNHFEYLLYARHYTIASTETELWGCQQ